eukprot:GHVL01013565.1.p1 GENE.GHVL01013565.1~~GHVL01013565.1.p1  ORF type:complete len:227 (+),score=70.78 GHVL01013565.1:95-682(+)
MVNIAENLQNMELKIDKLEEEVYRRKREYTGDDLIRCQKYNHELVIKLTQELDEISCKDSLLREYKRMLYAKLDTLDARVAVMDRQLSGMLMKDSSNKELVDIENEIDDLFQDVESYLSNNNISVNNNIYVNNNNIYVNKVTILQDRLEDLCINEDQLKELLSRKRGAYALLEMISIKIKKAMTNMNANRRAAGV